MTVLSVSQIGELLGENYERVKYAIKVANVQPAGKIGNANIFRRRDVDRIRATLATLGRIVKPSAVCG